METQFSLKLHVVIFEKKLDSCWKLPCPWFGDNMLAFYITLHYLKLVLLKLQTCHFLQFVKIANVKINTKNLLLLSVSSCELTAEPS